jgi:hypothetical protein
MANKFEPLRINKNAPKQKDFPTLVYSTFIIVKAHYRNKPYLHFQNWLQSRGDCKFKENSLEIPGILFCQDSGTPLRST